MEKMYRIKKEAVPFINEKFSTSVYPFEVWDSVGIDIKALDEVEPAYIKYGISYSDGKGSSLAGWGEKEGSHFSFTIVFPSMKYREYDEFGKGKLIRSLMDSIQKEINYFYSQFLNKQ